MFKSNPTPYLVKLPNWEGPLDLLLDLMKNARLKINEVSLEKITSDYLEMMGFLKEIKINQISQFIVMGITLSYIKSLRLLPVLDNENSEEIETVKKELINKLIEYQKYKKAASKLKLLEENDFVLKPENKKKKAKQIIYRKKKNLWQDISLVDLVKAMQEILDRYSFSKNLVQQKEISLEEKIKKIDETLEQKKTFKFSELIIDRYSKPISKREIIITFLAILELYKSEKINLKQDANFSDIVIKKVSP